MYLRAFVASILVATASVAMAQSPLDEVSAHLRAVNTMTADFAQTDRNGKTLTGQLTIKRPGQIRFQYQEGVPLLIVGDGRALNMIDYQVRQVSRWPIGNSPLGVLLDPSKDLSKFAKVVPAADPTMILVEAHDPKHREFGTITIVFRRAASAPTGLMLEGWTVIDAQSNRSSVRLSNEHYNVAVSDQTFRYRDPRPVGQHR